MTSKTAGASGELPLKIAVNQQIDKSQHRENECVWHPFFRIMKQFVFTLNLTTQEYMQYYRGSADKVIARCDDGRTVQFPAGLLTPHVTSWGVRGDFVLTCDEERKGAQLMRRQSHAMATAS